ncbi:MAG: helix-turn-helix transcriptional regulator [Clostridia bacterium]|nr:helix-turn-helix transcriptional regulator [Clostridia bacterium]
MNSSVLRECLDYIDFLKSLGYFVSLSGFNPKFDPYIDKLLNYEIHLHSVCFYLKQNKQAFGRCIRNKERLNSTKITAPYYDCCYAGVEEFVVPVIYEGEHLLRINISGYRGTLKKSQKFMERISLKCGNHFNQLYMELSPSPPKLNEIMRFINPLRYMITELYKHCQSIDNNYEDKSPTRQIFVKALRYINENYMQQISCDSLSCQLNYSTSYMQYVFKKEGNTTIKAHINNVRLSQAKHLLSHSHISVTDVALACGFLDSNYFSTAFKNKYGISPKKYRDMYFLSKQL